METEINAVKASLPSLIKNFSKFFELDLTIKIFGVKVFSFHYPPQVESKIVEPKIL